MSVLGEMRMGLQLVLKLRVLVEIVELGAYSSCLSSSASSQQALMYVFA